MKKQDWFIVTGVLVLLSVLDQLVQWFNMGASQSFFSVDVFAVRFYKTIVFNSIVGLYFLCLFFLVNFILIGRFLGLRLALSLFTAGMLGDSLSIFFHSSAVRAGLFQIGGIDIEFSYIYIVLGSLLTLFFIVRDHSLIFNKNNLRKTLIIEKNQYIFCFYVILPYLLFVFGFYMFFHIFIQISLASTSRVSLGAQSQIINNFFSLFSVLSLCFLLTLVIFIFYLSNKIYGPVYAFKKYIKDVLIKNKAKDQPFKLRGGDHFQDLPELAEELRQRLKKGAI